MSLTKTLCKFFLLSKKQKSCRLWRQLIKKKHIFATEGMLCTPDNNLYYTTKTYPPWIIRH